MPESDQYAAQGSVYASKPWKGAYGVQIEKFSFSSLYLEVYKGKARLHKIRIKCSNSPTGDTRTDGEICGFVASRVQSYPDVQVQDHFTRIRDV